MRCHLADRDRDVWQILDQVVHAAHTAVIAGRSQSPRSTPPVVEGLQLVGGRACAHAWPPPSFPAWLRGTCRFVNSLDCARPAVGRPREVGEPCTPPHAGEPGELGELHGERAPAMPGDGDGTALRLKIRFGSPNHWAPNSPRDMSRRRMERRREGVRGLILVTFHSDTRGVTERTLAKTA
ncbi:hypothetical protein ACH4UM_26350 [Streptomyces sp. NPDC020801]|uniref:hypothetical protein n=1 Tax=unclassified Streptomyces TaxID=2593676 RepID=UPI00378A2E06